MLYQLKTRQQLELNVTARHMTSRARFSVLMTSYLLIVPSTSTMAMRLPSVYNLFLFTALVATLPMALSVDDIRSRRRIYFGSMYSLHQAMPTHLKSSGAALVSNASRRRVVPIDEDPEEKENFSRVKMWPPWPFNLLTKSRRSDNGWDSSYGYRSSGLFWAYFRQQLQSTKRQMQHVGSQLWFHLPPAGAPLILLACLPQRRTLQGDAGVFVKSAPILFVNSFARNLVLASLGVAILSWSHSELNRKRRLVPLPLPEQYRDISRAILPIFLPEEVPDIDIEILRSMEKEVEDLPIKDKGIEESDVAEGLSPRVRRHLQNIYQLAEQKPRTLRTTLRQWGRMRELRRLEEAKVRRAGIIDELVALTTLKKKATRRKKVHDFFTEEKESVEPLGYALVTGASRGIGRAIAVELARWEIPLIIVARDVKRLTDLATEIETCYGVKCCVLQADLSEPGAAERVWATTKDAGLKVDILVNNAGVCSSGLSVDMPKSDVQQMMQINAISVAMLNHMYGRDMKDQGRGRILVVSSVVGSVEAGPNVACYAATKAFERSLAMSMGKELEQYGVGVTCLMPGAVRDTSFRSRSEVDEALCWKLPFYTRTAPLVAHQGVVAMLNGDVQVVPGWQNRAFVKVCKPILPQRLTTIIVQMAWSPFQFSRPKLKFPTFPALTEKIPPNDVKHQKSLTKGLVDVPSLWPGTSSKPPPRLLKLPEESTPVGEETKESVPLDNSSALDDPVASGGTGNEDRTQILGQPAAFDDLENGSRAHPNVEKLPLREWQRPDSMGEDFAFDDDDKAGGTDVHL